MGCAPSNAAQAVVPQAAEQKQEDTQVTFAFIKPGQHPRSAAPSTLALTAALADVLAKNNGSEAAMLSDIKAAGYVPSARCEALTNAPASRSCVRSA